MKWQILLNISAILIGLINFFYSARTLMAFMGHPAGKIEILIGLALYVISLVIAYKLFVQNSWITLGVFIVLGILPRILTDGYLVFALVERSRN